MQELLQGLDETGDPAADRPDASIAEGRRTAPTDVSERSEIALLSELLGRPLSTETEEVGVGWTDLHYAAALNLPDAVEALIEAGVAADVPLKTGWIPFGDGLRQTLRTLGHEAFETWAADGETPLMIAAAANAREAAEALVARGADMGATSANGDTPLLLAAWGNARETTEWLAAQGADIGATNNSGDTPLHWAALGGRARDGGVADRPRRRHQRHKLRWQDPVGLRDHNDRRRRGEPRGDAGAAAPPRRQDGGGAEVKGRNAKRKKAAGHRGRLGIAGNFDR